VLNYQPVVFVGVLSYSRRVTDRWLDEYASADFEHA
jgi:hypothetical protein